MTIEKQKGADSTHPNRDPDFIGADAAILRAAQVAREKARQTGVGVVYMKDGKIVQEQVEKAG